MSIAYDFHEVFVGALSSYPEIDGDGYTQVQNGQCILVDRIRNRLLLFPAAGGVLCISIDGGIEADLAAFPA